MSGHATTITRASVATKLAAAGQSLIDVASGAARYEKAAACGAVALTARGAWTPLAIDTVRDWLLCGKPAAINELYALKTAGGTPELVKDLSTVAGHVSGHYIMGAAANQGNWFVWMGVLTAQDGVALKCRLLKSVDAGVTWTAVKTTTYGPCVGGGLADFLGDLVAWGTYTTYSVAGGHAIFLSRDKGETWETVMEVASDPAVRRHSHGVRFDGPDRLYAIWGDPNTSRLERYDYADATWTATVIRDDFANSSGGNEGGVLVAGKVVLNGRWSSIYDPATGTSRRFGPHIPRIIETGQTPYGYTHYAGTFRHLYVDSAGVLYAPSYAYEDPAGVGDGGLYVSPDGGLHWASAVLTPTIRGLRNTIGPWNGLFWALQLAADGTNSMCSFPPVPASLVAALRLEAGCTNLLATEARSTFSVGAAKATAAECGWARAGGYDGGAALADASVVGADTDVAGVHGSHCLKLVSAAGAIARGRYNSPTVAMTEGDKITAAVWVRAKAPWPEGYNVYLGIAAATGSVAASTYLSTVLPSEDEWLPLIAELTCTATGTFYVYVQIGTQEPACTFAADDYVTPAAGAYAAKTGSLEIENGSPVRFYGGTLPAGIAASTTYYVRDWDGTKFKVAAALGGDAIDIPDNGSGTHYCWVLADWTLYMDAACVRASASRWDVSSFQIGGTARADESASVSLAGYTGGADHYDWALLFDWRPESGWAEFAADVPILSISTAGAEWLDLFYEVSTKQFVITAGAGTAKSDVCSFRHVDTVRFALSNSADGEDLALRVWDPVAGIHAEAVGEGLGVPGPVAARFGRDNTGAIFGVGLFHSLGVRRGGVSAAEFASIVARPGWSWDRPLSEMALTDVES